MTKVNALWATKLAILSELVSIYGLNALCAPNYIFEETIAWPPVSPTLPRDST